MDITRNRQTVTFDLDNADGDIVQTSDFLNSANLPIPLHDYLINGVHVVASTGPLARQAIRERNAQLDAANDATTAPADDAAATPETHHPGRCYCRVFDGEYHVPGMIQPGAYGSQCKGDRGTLHNPKSCPACLAGATDFRPRVVVGQVWKSPYGTEHKVTEVLPTGTVGMINLDRGHFYLTTQSTLIAGYTLADYI